MAPSSAAMTTCIPDLKASARPIVLATLKWSSSTVTNPPRRLKTAASATAWPGDSARVETEVAIALAVSWNPLVKSKATAATMVAKSSASSILDGDRLEHVGGRLAAVHGPLEEVVDVLPLDEVGRRLLLGEERRQRLPGQEVGLVLEPVDLDPSRLEVLEALQVLERALEDVPGLGQVLAHLAGGFGDLLHLVEVDLVGDLLGEVDYVVER